jgi:hypothetical protein
MTSDGRPVATILRPITICSSVQLHPIANGNPLFFPQKQEAKSCSVYPPWLVHFLVAGLHSYFDSTPPSETKFQSYLMAFWQLLTHWSTG